MITNNLGKAPTVKDFFEFVEERGKKMYERDEEIEPCVLILNANKDIVYASVSIFFENDGSKEFFTSVILPHLLLTSKAIAYVMITEAWVSHYEASTRDKAAEIIKKRPQPKNDPNHIEVIMFSKESFRSCEMVYYEVKNGKITDNRMVTNEVEGRFAHILSKPEKLNN